MSLIAAIMLIAVAVSPLYFQWKASTISQPIIVDNYKEGNLLWIQLKPDSEGIDYQGSYAKTLDGAILKCESFDVKKCKIAFDTSESDLNIYILNYAGNVTHALYSEK